MTSEAWESRKKPRKRDKNAKRKYHGQETVTIFATANEPQEVKQDPTLKPKKCPKKKGKIEKDGQVTADTSAEVPFTNILEAIV